MPDLGQGGAWIGWQWCREHGSYYSVHPGWCPGCRKEIAPPSPPVGADDEHTPRGRA